MPKTRRRSFTLRFEDAETHELLTLLSSRMGISMNRLAEAMIQNEIQAAAFALQEDLSHTLARLADYREDARRDIAKFAHGEIAFQDPLKARMVFPRDEPHDISSTFAAAAASHKR